MVGLGMLVELVQQVQGFVLVALGLAWVLLLDVVVLRLGFLRGLGVLVLRFLLGPGCFLGFVFGLVLVFSSSLLDLYSEESSSFSWSWSWADDSPGAVGVTGGAAFFTGAAGLSLAGVDGAAGALVKRPCLSLGSEMVAIWSDQFSPGVCSRPFKGTRRGTGSAGLR